jgi:exopolyphosphatase/guanosine-5'-triphosphate,3'-diphosphate pyrophosphatase
LADIAWRVHPEYRANVAFWRVLGEQYAGLDHDGRVFLATALFERYPGGVEADEAKNIRSSVSEAARVRARVLGRTLRLGLTLSGGVSGTLGKCRLVLNKGVVSIETPDELKGLVDETIDKRVQAINEALERTPGGSLLTEAR